MSDEEWRRRYDRLEALLPMIADALDVRAVFPRMSAVIQEVVPHVSMSLALLTPDGGGVRIHVASNFEVDDLPEYRFSAENETISKDWRSFIAYDCAVVKDGVVRVQVSHPDQGEPTFIELRPGGPFARMAAEFGYRSLLRVPVPSKIRLSEASGSHPIDLPPTARETSSSPRGLRTTSRLLLRTNNSPPRAGAPPRRRSVPSCFRSASNRSSASWRAGARIARLASRRAGSTRWCTRRRSPTRILPF
jgi:hypothetical protein